MPDLRYQTKDIANPGPNDVMFGRGGGTNNHTGNKRFRQLVNDHKLRYLAASKVDKPKVAREVVNIWRNQEVPGRFLSKADKGKDSLWYDVGEQRAREKASQCLRERTPDVMPFVKMHQQQAQQQGQQQAQQEPPEKPKTKQTAVCKSSTRSKVRQELHDLHEIQQQQLKNKHARHRQPPVLIEEPPIPIEFDAAAVAVALLEEQQSGKEDPMIKDYLKKLATMQRNEDDSIDENASATAIARAIFKNVKSDNGDEMSLDDMLIPNAEGNFDDLDEALDTLSKFSWSDGADRSLMSLTRIGEDVEGISPDDVVSSHKLQKMNSKRTYNSSNRSTISDLTDILDDGGRDAMSIGTFMTREKKMEQVKNKQTSMSNVSMFSSLTDVTGMTGSFSNLEV